MNPYIFLSQYPAYQRLELLEHYANQAETAAEIQAILQVFNDDEDPIVRHEVVAQLIRLAREKPDLLLPLREQIKQAFLGSLSDESIVVRHEVIEALSYIGDERTLEILRKYIDDPESDIRATAKLSYELLALRLKHNLRPHELLHALLSGLS